MLGRKPMVDHARQRARAVDGRSMMLKLKRIDNLDILCRDLEAVATFYHDTLGLEYFLPYQPELGWAALSAGNLTMYLFQTDVGEHAPWRTAINEENPPGLDSIAFDVEIGRASCRVDW